MAHCFLVTQRQPHAREPIMSDNRFYIQSTVRAPVSGSRASPSKTPGVGDRPRGPHVGVVCRAAECGCFSLRPTSLNHEKTSMLRLFNVRNRATRLRSYRNKLYEEKSCVCSTLINRAQPPSLSKHEHEMLPHGDSPASSRILGFKCRKREQLIGMFVS